MIVRPVIRPADIDLDFAPLRSARAVELVVDEDLVLLDPDSGSTHVLNPTGRVFWSGLDGRTSLQELTEDLALVLDAPTDDLIAPVLGWARTLGHNGLLDGVAPSEADLLGIGASVPVGTVLPTVVGERMHDGASVHLPDFGGRPMVLLNWSFGCGYCLSMLDALEQVRPALAAHGWDVVLLVAEARADVEASVHSRALADVVVLTDATDESPFHELGTPVAYIVGGDGIVLEPLAIGGDEVAAALRGLAGLAPVPATVERATALEAPDEDTGGLRYLPLAPSSGVCAPSGSTPARTWTGVDTFMIGGLVIGVRSASASAGQRVRQLLASTACDGEHRLPNYSVVLPGLDDTNGRDLNLLLWGDVVVVRSRSVRRILEALLAHLGTHVAAEEPGVWPVAALPVVRGGRAVLLPGELRASLAQVQPRLARAGLSMVDLPAAIVDSGTAELVIPPLTIPHDAAVVHRLGPLSTSGSEQPPAAPGRYRLAAWLFPDPGPEVSAAATSVALAVAAIARPKDMTLLAEVTSFLHRMPVAVRSDPAAMIATAAEYLREA